MHGHDRAANWPFGLLGAVGGGALGYFAFFWIARQGFYALALPGATMGFGCGSLSGGRSRALGLVCGLSSVLLAILAEWQFAPFVADQGLGYFLTHLGDLTPVTMVMIVAGGIFAFWFGAGRRGGVSNQAKTGSP